MKAACGFTALAVPLALVVGQARSALVETGSLALEAARRILAAPRSDQHLGTISLAGFDFSRELELGKGIRVIAVSCNLGGGLAAFGADGTSIGTLATDQITWLQLFDLNEDGVSEVTTEEIEGRGTGVLTKNFSVYAISPQGIKKVWQGVSYARQAPWNPSNTTPRIEEKRSFLRFDSSGAGRKARMTYLFPTRDGRGFQETIFEMEGEALQERAKALPGSVRRGN